MKIEKAIKMLPVIGTLAALAFGKVDSMQLDKFYLANDYKIPLELIVGDNLKLNENLTQEEKIKLYSEMAKVLGMSDELVSYINGFRKLSDSSSAAGRVDDKDNIIEIRDSNPSTEEIDTLISNMVHEYTHVYDLELPETLVKDFALDIAEFASVEGVDSIDKLRKLYPEFYEITRSIVIGDVSAGYYSRSYNGIFKDQTFEQIQKFYNESDYSNPTFKLHQVDYKDMNINPSLEIAASTVENVRYYLTPDKVPPAYIEWIYKRINKDELPIIKDRDAMLALIDKVALEYEISILGMIYMFIALVRYELKMRKKDKEKKKTTTATFPVVK
ncbi:MAG: hypothetical protein ACMG57_02690 [Candidatus Dojkabacteria bacterium]